MKQKDVTTIRSSNIFDEKPLCVMLWLQYIDCYLYTMLIGNLLLKYLHNLLHVFYVCDTNV